MPDPDGRFVPGLAESFRLEDDGRKFVFTMRRGATFHDGQAVTADGVCADRRAGDAATMGRCTA